MKDRFPLHVAIIPDGNRRWAKENHLLPLQGHVRGYERANELITEAKRAGIRYLTLWAFSTENWNRDMEEVCHLLALIEKGLRELATKVHTEHARFIHLGRKDRLNDAVRGLIEQLEAETRLYSDLTLCLAIDYGGEDEVNRAIEAARHGNDESKTLYDYLDTTRKGVPSPDLIIRTSGEHRTSGFMPLQSLYSEWYFDDLHFPQFDAEAFQRALESYAKRDRRFGR